MPHEAPAFPVLASLLATHANGEEAGKRVDNAEERNLECGVAEIDATSGMIETRPSRARWRWGLHLLLLTAYPLVLGIVGAKGQSGSSSPMLPTEIPQLLRLLSIDFALFAVVFGLAVVISRPTGGELMLAWRSGGRPVLRGFLYSIILRGGLFVLVLGIAVVASLASGSGEHIAEQLRPETEQLVDAKALAAHPAYFVVNVTLVSFVFAGFREELWRAGMLAGFRGLRPAWLVPKAGEWIAVLFSAAVFGLGHLAQGWGGVLMTAALGFGLGLMMVRYDSIWEAVLAHGFFNATTFVLLYVLARYWPEMIPRVV